MEKATCMVLFGALAVTILVQVTTAQKVHVVGEGIGWTIPINGGSTYEMWASGKNFNVGDTLVFSFTTTAHIVQEVSSSSYDECNTQNAIGKPITTGPANVTLTSPGDHYYICTVSKHCQAGQKLAITVSASNTPGDNASATPSSSTVIFTSFLLSLSSIALTIFL